MRRWPAAAVHNFLCRLSRQQPYKGTQCRATRVFACFLLPLKAGCFVPEVRGKRTNRLLGATLHCYGSIILIRNYDNIMVGVNQHNRWVTIVAQLMTNFEWGTLKNGFATVDGVFLPIHPRRSRGEASFVSSHGSIVGNDYRLPFTPAIHRTTNAMPQSRIKSLYAGNTPSLPFIASERSDCMPGRIRLAPEIARQQRRRRCCRAS